MHQLRKLKLVTVQSNMGILATLKELHRFVVSLNGRIDGTISPENPSEPPTMASGSALRNLGIVGAKFIAGPGWLVTGVIASPDAAGTGQLATQYLTGGRYLSWR